MSVVVISPGFVLIHRSSLEEMTNKAVVFYLGKQRGSSLLNKALARHLQPNAVAEIYIQYALT